MNFSSFYARLRLTAAATQSEIKSAYYRLSKIYHPDRNNNCPKATTQFRNITEAYETLSDPKSKAVYDSEYFPRARFGGAAARFRTSNRRRFQESVDTKTNSYVDDLNSKVDKRIRQYRIQVENKANQ